MSLADPPLNLDDPELRESPEEAARRVDEEIFWYKQWRAGKVALPEWRESDPPSEGRARSFCHILLQALEFNSDCWHAFRDEETAALRQQVHMPVGSWYESPAWSRLPKRFNDGRDAFFDGDEEYDDWAMDPFRIGIPERRLEAHPYDPIWLSAYPDPPEPASSKNWAWVEFWPLESFEVRPFFHCLRYASSMRRGDESGVLEIRYRGILLETAVVFKGEADARIYFGEGRPPIRPKNWAHYRELGLTAPGDAT